MPGVPRDTFFGRGYLGQYLVIVPSENLVVVRFGVSHGPGGDIRGTGALAHDVIAALHAGVASR
jgi:CubicO group peptidase (beta-lactamase class C family)